MPHTHAYTHLSALIADPNEYLGKLTASMLRTLGLRAVRTVNSGHLALAALNCTDFDFFMVDADLAGIDGIELTRRLRAGECQRNRELPVIMMASTPDAERILRARDAGISEFLRKPFAANHIESRLQNIFNAPRAFIDAPSYAGPDRRRHTDAFVGDNRRLPTNPDGSTAAEHA